MKRYKKQFDEDFEDNIKNFIIFYNKFYKNKYGNLFSTSEMSKHGVCDRVSDLYANFNKKAKVILGIYPTAFENIFQHTANIIGNKVIDFTAKQFSNENDVPTIMSLDSFLKKFKFKKVVVAKDWYDANKKL